MSQYYTDTAVSFASQSADSISRRAYEIWESEGRPEGCDLKHWLQAEQELSADPDRAERNAATGSARHTGTDTRPLQGTRAAQANSRGSKRNSRGPFVTEKNGASGSGNANPAAVSGDGKAKPASAPMM